MLYLKILRLLILLRILWCGDTSPRSLSRDIEILRLQLHYCTITVLRYCTINYYTIARLGCCTTVVLISTDNHIRYLRYLSNIYGHYQHKYVSTEKEKRPCAGHPDSLPVCSVSISAEIPLFCICCICSVCD